MAAMDDNRLSLSAREYQLEMLRLAKEGNVIVKLNTGSGKTFIASMLIKHMLPYTRDSLSEGSKRIVFLVKTVQLVVQQALAIRQHTYLDEEVGEYHGQLWPPVDFWEKEKWRDEFEKHRVLVFSACVFKDILLHAKFSLESVCLLIFDECHHTAKADDYAQIAELFPQFPANQRPKVLGLTASVVNGKVQDIASHVRELEARMCARLVTSSDPQATLFSRDTKEHTVSFNETTTASWLYLSEMLERPLADLKAMVDNKKMMQRLAESGRMCRSSYVDLDAPSPASRSGASGSTSVNVGYLLQLLGAGDNLVKKSKRALSDCVTAIQELGPWCALEIARETEKDLSRFKNCPDADERKAVQIALEALQTFLALLISVNVTPTQEWLSHRVKILVGLLKKLCVEKNSSAQGIHGVLFVKERQTAFVLSKLFNHLDTIEPVLHPLIRANYVTGHGIGTLQHKEASMDIKKQTKILQDFRQGKVNLLVATRVVEEGMDVRDCNLVIKFSFPEDYRSYVQSKGRARMPNSMYVVFISNSPKPRQRQENKLDEYQRISHQLEAECINRAVDRECFEEEEEEDDRFLFSCQRNDIFCPLGQRGPRVTLNTAMSLVNRYMGRLRHDCIATPRLVVFVRDEGDGRVGYMSIPNPCPIRDVIVGRRARSKRKARKWVALEACRRLYAINELGRDLLPIPPIKASAGVEDEPEEFDASGNSLPRTGTRKRRRPYDLPLAKELSEYQRTNSSNQVGGKRLKASEGGFTSTSVNSQVHVFRKVGNKWEAFLYAFSVAPLPMEQFSITDEISADDNIAIGLLLPKKLQSSDTPGGLVAELPLFFSSSPSRAKLLFLGCQSLTLADLSLASSFHEHAVSALLECHGDPAAVIFDLGAARQPFLCPLAQLGAPQCGLALAAMQSVVQLASTRSFADLPRAQWTGALARAAHRGAAATRRELWLVEAVDCSLSPASPFPEPSKASSYADYFARVHGTPVADLRQPLLRVRRVPSLAGKVLAPTGEDEGSARARRRLDFNAHLVPELCQHLALPGRVWLRVAPLPALLRRLHHLLLARQLRRVVLGTSDAGPMLLRGPDELEAGGGPPPARDDLTHLVEALTTKECHDFLNLECLEAIGDSFLKFAATVTLHATANGAREQEGHLSAKRTALVRNANLFRKAPDLVQYLWTRRFTVREDFEPPGFVQRQRAGDSAPLWNREVSDKSIADAVEALIGYFLLHHSEDAALRCMVRLKLDPGFLVRDGRPISFPPVPEPLLENVRLRRFEDELRNLSDGFDKVESELKYSFKRKEFLLQALTHASYHDNRVTECYQKLEFLGDAVLDYLITRQVYTRSTNMSPGHLTDARSALVNNKTFATMTVRCGFHRHIKYHDQKLMRLIPEFAEVVEEGDDDPFCSDKFGGKSEEEQCVKILGDVFESVTGAVYLDSGRCLQTVKRIFCDGIMKDIIEKFSETPPINPVRKLHEKYPNFSFSACTESRDPESGLVRLTGSTGRGQSVTVEKRNKSCCKLAIAKHFLTTSS